MYEEYGKLNGNILFGESIVSHETKMTETNKGNPMFSPMGTKNLIPLVNMN